LNQGLIWQRPVFFSAFALVASLVLAGYISYWSQRDALRQLEAHLETALIQQLLKRYDGTLAPMARALQANRSTLRRKLSGKDA